MQLLCFLQEIYQLSTECHKKRELEVVMISRVVRKLDLKLGAKEEASKWREDGHLPETLRAPPPQPLSLSHPHPERLAQDMTQLMQSRTALTHKEGHIGCWRRGQGSGARTPDFLAL